MFPCAEIMLDENYHSRRISDRFTVECDRDPLEFPYIDQIILNGNKLDRRYLSYEEITSGGHLRLTLKK